MSHVDRDWYREADVGPRGWGGTPACWGLIGLHLVAWALLAGAGALGALGPLALRAEDVLRRGRVHELVTYAIAWGDGAPLDLLWTLACLLVFGREVEARTGARRFLLLYGGAVLSVGAFALAWIAFLGGRGAFAGGVGAGVALLVGDALARRYASVLGVPLSLAAVLLVAVPASQHLALEGDATWAAHLFGIAVGIVFARRGGFDRRAGAASSETSAEGTEEERTRASEAEGAPDVEGHVDALLAKIQREGLASLTGDEKAYLERVSKKFRDP